MFSLGSRLLARKQFSHKVSIEKRKHKKVDSSAFDHDGSPPVALVRIAATHVPCICCCTIASKNFPTAKISNETGAVLLPFLATTTTTRVVMRIRNNGQLSGTPPAIFSFNPLWVILLNPTATVTMTDFPKPINCLGYSVPLLG